MDVSNLILKTDVSSAAQMGNIKKPDDGTEAKKIEFAKNFESRHGKLLLLFEDD